MIWTYKNAWNVLAQQNKIKRSDRMINSMRGENLTEEVKKKNLCFRRSSFLINDLKDKLIFSTN